MRKGYVRAARAARAFLHGESCGDNYTGMGRLFAFAVLTGSKQPDSDLTHRNRSLTGREMRPRSRRQLNAVISPKRTTCCTDFVDPAHVLSVDSTAFSVVLMLAFFETYMIRALASL